MPIEISNYDVSDYEAVWKLHKNTVRDNAAYVKNLAFHTDFHDIPNVYRNFFVMKEDGRLVGMIGLKQTDPHTIEIKRLQIAASHQGQGLGRQLMEFILGYIDTIGGISRLCLDVNETQIKASQLYASLGFQITHTDERFLGPDKERFMSIYLEKAL